MRNWSLIYDKYQPELEPLHEALTTLGNGYFATRGASEECQADTIHYPGTYLAGGFNRLQSKIGDHTIINEDLVNWPNWLHITFCVEKSHWFNLNAVDILHYHQELNLLEGFLQRTVRFQDHSGRESTLASRRIVHMENPHYGAIEYSITAHNWSGEFKIKSSLDGAVINDGVKRYKGLNSKHLSILALGQFADNLLYLQVETNQSHIRMAQVVQHRIYSGELELTAKATVIKETECITQEYNLTINRGETVRVEKIMALCTSKDNALNECLEDAYHLCQQAGNFASLLESQRLAWLRLWRRCDIEVDSDGDEPLILRLYIFHLLQTISAHSIHQDVGVPARGLHGEAYRGHIFWDEIFIVPFYSSHLPAQTHALLLYRYHRLNMARALAKEEGFQGAMYPWQSASNGQEETQVIHLNPRTNQWGLDLSRYQRHINAAIVYNLWQYYRMTHDTAFLSLYGAEMAIEIARFFSSIATFDTLNKRYEIQHVVGPDEYHEQYPNKDTIGLNNNAYTNIMAVWVLETAMRILSLLPSFRQQELRQQLALTDIEMERWCDITHKMFVPFHNDQVISQFEGYEHLQEFDWDGYSKKYGNIERLDRILKAEDDSPNGYKVSKQADVLMLFYLFSKEELKRIFHKLGYIQFNENSMRQTIAYYQQRTTHGSSLSKLVFASELSFLDTIAARSLLQEALQTDFTDSQGTTHEGIHLGTMAGVLNIFIRQYAGIDIKDDKTDRNKFNLHIHPCLPHDIRRLRLRIQHNENWYLLDLNHQALALTFESGIHATSLVYVYERKISLKKGKMRRIKL